MTAINSATDGFKTLISFSSHSALILEEISLKPPGFDGGDAIDLTSMRSTAYRTSAPKSLISITNPEGTVAYDPADLVTIRGLINHEELITIFYPDNETSVDFYGFLKSFEPETNEEGKRPTAKVVFVVTNRNAGTETGPNFK